MRYAFADRAAYLGDPAFVNVPIKGLTSKIYADELRGKFHQGKATPSIDVKAGNPQRYEGNHTTDFTIVDKWGNAVVINFTIRDWFGSAAAVNGAGFFTKQYDRRSFRQVRCSKRVWFSIWRCQSYSTLLEYH